ncbi:Gfo/Idh/MocA family protein [Anaeromicropila herbilytica]|uniref:Dehydrogenase n=1 Tax=Anaeromicropila herbilytica TaxID=2785025 RepID=A0A7R7EK35_9FIRM|nr:Gfo/Idh/MocA family oxidoreductase [Anaeromicropila herbilytica]BCN29912.1 dehydrogenase [Anaeromicropila herbilytica]
MYRWGILATGGIASTFAKALNYVEDATLYAVASRNQKKANEFAEEYGIEKAYDSYEKLVQDEKVDIIYIATPMNCHYDNVKLCLEHGKNVLCEKAITINAKQLEELITLAKEKDVFFMEAMWTKCLPAFQKAKEWIKEGKIGKVQMIKADFCNQVPYQEESRLFRKDLGGGAILDLGVYPISFATSFLGTRPNRIISNARMGQSEVDFDCGIMLQYDNAFAILSCGFDILCNNNATIIGSEGTISFGDWFFTTPNVNLYNSKLELIEEVSLPHECNGYEYEIMEVHRCLGNKQKESTLIPLSDTLDIMKIMDQCRKDCGLVYPEE